jgi:hypothetical protein
MLERHWRNTLQENHQEEAKLQHLHIPHPHITSPLHIKWRNQEGSRAAHYQLLPAQEKQTTRWAKQHAVLPQTTLGQISIAPWTDWPPPMEKREKNKLNNKQHQKKMRSKEGGVHWALKGGRGNSSQNSRKGWSGGPRPTKLDQENM